MERTNTSLLKVLKSYFNIFSDKENEKTTIENVANAVDFHGAQLWILIFAIFIASLGLNVNSTAVIIGAMLISPLMGPIIGMGMAVGISDLNLLKRSAKNYLVATIISVLTATIYFTITPLTEAQSELLARTSPTLYDVLIAICGGAAGFIALSTKGKGNVIPGVAIATALMPPLCTAGYGIAMRNFTYFIGAFYLFFINTVFICLATFIGTRMLRFKRVKFVNPERMAKVKKYIIAIVLLTMLPATYMTALIIKQSIMKNNIRKFVKNEFTFKGTQIISQNYNESEKTLNIVAVGKTITPDEIIKAGKELTEYQLNGYKLNIIQGSQSDSLLLLNRELNSATLSGENSNQKILEQSQQLYELEKQLNQYTRYEILGKEISNELRVIYPSVTKISISNVSETRMDSASVRKYIMAVIGSKNRLNTKEKQQIRLWLKVRIKADSIRLITTQ